MGIRKTENQNFIDLYKMFPEAKNAKGRALYKLREFQKRINSHGILPIDSNLLSKMYADIFPSPKDVENFFTRVLKVSVAEMKQVYEELEDEVKYVERMREIIEELEKDSTRVFFRPKDGVEWDLLVLHVPRRITGKVIALILEDEIERKHLDKLVNKPNKNSGLYD